MSDGFLRIDQNLIRKSSIANAEVVRRANGYWYVRIESSDSKRFFFSDPKRNRKEATTLLDEIQHRLESGGSPTVSDESCEVDYLQPRRARPNVA